MGEPGDALRCLFTSGMAAAPRGLLLGAALGVPVCGYVGYTFAYAGAMIGGPIAGCAAALGGAVVGFLAGGLAGLYRAGYRWGLLLLPAALAVLILAPYGLYERAERTGELYRTLVVMLADPEPSRFLAALHEPQARVIVAAHLEQFLVCASRNERPELVDAVADLDPRRTQGVALCAAAEYGKPSIVRHLLASGYLPARAHRLSGAPCDPVHELIAASDATSPCSLSMFGDFDQFTATPSPAGCRHRAEVASLLIAAGAQTPAGGVLIPGCATDAGGQGGDGTPE